MHTMPSGTVTFLFTDIEGSTQLGEKQPEAMQVALERHDALMRQSVARLSNLAAKTIDIEIRRS